MVPDRAIGKCLCLKQPKSNNLIVMSVALSWVCGCSCIVGLVTERLRVRFTPGPLQATLSKLLTYCVLRPTQPPTLSGTGNE